MLSNVTDCTYTVTSHALVSPYLELPGLRSQARKNMGPPRGMLR